ncbi:hypothetical protein GCM10010218_44980 [Streptomyces mashuensis]|uniref:DUF3592 domain-containing protein n=1 Tax=Streptomyces mashuensis TaxID=33904 RepID=A0A919B751_9ACTN|nr:DUF3592 domain-containing protein [Streptomyces mashuensis]GHF58669.1 hypothetical protein GCM10010218_44980 [Streptomyces mashuensis]
MKTTENLRPLGPKGRRWLAGGLIVFGTVFLAIGLVLGWMSLSLATDGKRTHGTVVSLDWRDGDQGPVAYAVVGFTSADGEKQTFQDSFGSNPPAYKVGERVEVLYHADHPDDASISGFASLWVLPLIFGGAGLVVATVGTVIAVLSRRRRLSAGTTRR